MKSFDNCPCCNVKLCDEIDRDPDFPQRKRYCAINENLPQPIPLDKYSETVVVGCPIFFQQVSKDNQIYAMRFMEKNYILTYLLGQDKTRVYDALEFCEYARKVRKALISGTHICAIKEPNSVCIPGIILPNSSELNNLDPLIKKAQAN